MAEGVVGLDFIAGLLNLGAMGILVYVGHRMFGWIEDDRVRVRERQTKLDADEAKRDERVLDYLRTMAQASERTAQASEGSFRFLERIDKVLDRGAR